MQRCIYCKEEKKDSEFTDEHVLPQGIGGNLTPVNPFKTNEVCGRCNRLCGLFVDRPFIRSWFTHNHRVEEAKKYIKLSNNLALPLTYYGPVDGLIAGDNICEFWQGPAWDSIYHFHQPYPEEPDVPITIGPPPHFKEEKIDPGFAFLFVSTNNPAWLPTVAYSFATHFKKSTLYLGNGPTPERGLFSDIPSELRELHAKLKAMGGQTHKVNFSISVDYGDRFLAKLLLGMGHLFLGPTFSFSDSGDLLRKALWTKRRDDRETIPIYGQSFFGGSSGFDANLLSWPGGHLMALIPFQGKLALLARIYGKQEAFIAVPADTQPLGDSAQDGIVFVLAPGLQTYAGPIKLAEFLAHRQKIGSPDGQLAELENKMRESAGTLPPFKI